MSVYRLPKPPLRKAFVHYFTCTFSPLPTWRPKWRNAMLLFGDSPEKTLMAIWSGRLNATFAKQHREKTPTRQLFDATSKKKHKDEFARTNYHAPGNQKHQSFALIKWLAKELRPLSMVDSLNFKETHIINNADCLICSKTARKQMINLQKTAKRFQENARRLDN